MSVLSELNNKFLMQISAPSLRHFNERIVCTRVKERQQLEKGEQEAADSSSTSPGKLRESMDEEYLFLLGAIFSHLPILICCAQPQRKRSRRRQ